MDKIIRMGYGRGMSLLKALICVTVTLFPLFGQIGGGGIGNGGGGGGGGGCTINCTFAGTTTTNILLSTNYFQVGSTGTAGTLHIYDTVGTDTILTVPSTAQLSTNLQQVLVGGLGFPASMTVATIPASYGVSQVAAIGSSGSPILLYTAPSLPNSQSYLICPLLVADTNASDPGTVTFFLAWTDVANHAQSTVGPTVAVGVNGVSGGACYPITPKAGTTVSFYTTYTAGGTSQYGLSGFMVH